MHKKEGKLIADHTVETASEGVQLRILSRELLAADDGSELPLFDSVAALFTGGGGVLINNRSSLQSTITVSPN